MESSDELNRNQKLYLIGIFSILLVALLFVIWGNKPFRNIFGKIKKIKRRRRRN